MTTTERTAAQRGKANGDKGKRAERAVVDAFLAAGFPDARRAVATGVTTAARTIADPGDVAGIPRTVVSVKDCAQERLTAWTVELEAMRAGANAAHALLVVKRRGTADAARWWCWMTWAQLNDLLGGHLGPLDLVDPTGLVRTELAPVLALLADELDEDLAAARDAA